jgi:hypothetical protein
MKERAATYWIMLSGALYFGSGDKWDGSRPVAPAHCVPRRGDPQRLFDPNPDTQLRFRTIQVLRKVADRAW